MSKRPKHFAGGAVHFYLSFFLVSDVMHHLYIRTSFFYLMKHVYV